MNAAELIEFLSGLSPDTRIWSYHQVPEEDYYYGMTIEGIDGDGEIYWSRDVR